MTNREQSIRERAHEIWESEGRPEGRDTQHWEQARRELTGIEDIAGSKAAKTTRSATKPVSKGKAKGDPKKSAEGSSVSEIDRNVSVLGEKSTNKKKRTQS